MNQSVTWIGIHKLLLPSMGSRSLPSTAKRMVSNGGMGIVLLVSRFACRMAAHSIFPGDTKVEETSMKLWSKRGLSVNFEEKTLRISTPDSISITFENGAWILKSKGAKFQMLDITQLSLTTTGFTSILIQS